jgi:hypothetical protein
MKDLEKRIEATAKYLVRLVQGSQLLEDAALDEEAYQQLIEFTIKLVREGDPKKISVCHLCLVNGCYGGCFRD